MDEVSCIDCDTRAGAVFDRECSFSCSTGTSVLGPSQQRALASWQLSKRPSCTCSCHGIKQNFSLTCFSFLFLFSLYQSTHFQQLCLISAVSSILLSSILQYILVFVLPTLLVLSFGISSPQNTFDQARGFKLHILTIVFKVSSLLCTFSSLSNMAEHMAEYAHSTPSRAT